MELINSKMNERSVGPTGDLMVNKALHFIWNNSYSGINAIEVADYIGVTARTLERHFKDSYERSVASEIIHYRLFRAEKMLKDPSLLVKYIAYMCGFTDVRNMIRAFHQAHGMSPIQYRLKVA